MSYEHEGKHHMRLLCPLLLSVFAGGTLLFVSGCGSGGGSAPAAPIATVSPVATPAPCVSAVTATPIIPAPSRGVLVVWTAPCGVDPKSIIEYHIFRNVILVGVTDKTQSSFTDGPQGGYRIYYQIPAPEPNSLSYEAVLVTDRLAQFATGSVLFGGTQTVSPFTSIYNTYQVTVVYQTMQNNKVEYVERTVGVTGPIPPL